MRGSQNTAADLSMYDARAEIQTQARLQDTQKCMFLECSSQNDYSLGRSDLVTSG